MKRCGKIEAVGLLNKNNVSYMTRDLQHKGGAGRGHSEKKWAKTPGPGRGQTWTLSSQVSLFSGKNGTLLQQYAIGMSKVSGFALFAIKSHRVYSFSKKCPEGPIREKAGLIPEYPHILTHTYKHVPTREVDTLTYADV
jgi:hypothetical protein